MTKSKKFRVGQRVYSKVDRDYVRLLARSQNKGVWWVEWGIHAWTLKESEIRPLTKRESAK